MELGDTTTCFYQFVFDENDSNGTNTLPYFIMHGLGLFIKSNSFVAHICSMNGNSVIIQKYQFPITRIKQFFFNTYNTVFAWVDGNSNKNRTYR